jgi:hypothetical protein
MLATGGKPATAGEQATAGDPNVSKKIYFKRDNSNKDATSTETLQAGLEATEGTPANEGMPSASKTLWQQYQQTAGAPLTA